MDAKSIPYRKLSEAEVTILQEIYGPFYSPSWQGFTHWPNDLRDPVVEISKKMPGSKILLGMQEGRQLLFLIEDGGSVYTATPSLQEGLSKEMLRKLEAKWENDQRALNFRTKYHAAISFLVATTIVTIAALVMAPFAGPVLLHVLAIILAIAAGMTAAASAVYLVTAKIYDFVRYHRRWVKIGKAVLALQTVRTEKEIEEENARLAKIYPSKETVLRSMRGPPLSQPAPSAP